MVRVNSWSKSIMIITRKISIVSAHNCHGNDDVDLLVLLLRFEKVTASFQNECMSWRNVGDFSSVWSTLVLDSIYWIPLLFSCYPSLYFAFQRPRSGWTETVKHPSWFWCHSLQNIPPNFQNFSIKEKGRSRNQQFRESKPSYFHHRDVFDTEDCPRIVWLKHSKDLRTPKGPTIS